MTPNLQRGLLLYEQSRFELAEPEFRQSLASDPSNAYTRAMLGLTLAHQARFKEAEAEIAEALKLDPGFAFVHYARARILEHRRRYKEASAAIEEAIRLDPESADYRAQQSQTYLAQRKWKEALSAAEIGMQIDPQHVGCTNLRTIALVKLGRREEAGASIRAALARNPENSVTHANQGWTLLETGKHKEALEHFRESLRLDPENEWARQGTIEALKARHLTYSLMLKYFLWMNRLSRQMQWGVILGGYFGMKVLAGLAKTYPNLAPWVLPIQILYLVFVFLSWTADPLFNLLLRLNKFGRLALNRKEIVASNWVGTFVGIALLFLAAGLVINSDYLLGAFVFGFSVLPVTAVFKCPAGWPRRAMTTYAAVVIGAGVTALISMFGGTFIGNATLSIITPIEGTLFSIFLFGILLAGWVANFLIVQRVKK